MATRLRLHTAELDTELLFSPIGGTSIDQPLDQKVFAERKSRTRGEFRQAGVQGVPLWQAIAITSNAWMAILSDSRTVLSPVIAFSGIFQTSRGTVSQ
jgi:hypothetical protein